MRSSSPSVVAAFVGREHERGKVADLVAGTRVVTLVGSGGCGKTRLAAEVVRDLAARFPDGVCWVDLQGVSEPAMVAQALGAVVGVHEHPGQRLAETLSEQLDQRHLLIVLDNCEHLVAACADLVALLTSRCPQVHLLATSRVPLVVEGEASFEVAPLPVPDPGARSVAAIASAAAVRLFEIRARQVNTDFRIAEENAQAVAEICRRLDGIPLAIELAAARVRVLAPGQIAAALTDRFALLTGGPRGVPARQRTLEASLDWSFDLLDEAHQVALARLSVFAGSFEMDAAQAVVGPDGVGGASALDLVAGLVDQSMVQVIERQGSARYRLLESVRVYAGQQLADVEPDRVRDRHLAFHVGLAAQAQVGLNGARPEPWMERLNTELDDLRAAMDWAAESHDLRALVGMTAGILRFWFDRTMSAEVHRRLHDASSEAGAPEDDRARALLTAANLAFAANDLTSAYRSARSSVVAARTSEVEGALALGLGMRALFGAMSGRVTGADVDSDLEESVRLVHQCEDPPTRAQILAYAGAAGLQLRSLDAGCDLFEEAVTVCESHDLAFQLPAAHAGHAMWSAFSGRLDRTRDHASRSVELSRAAGRPGWESTGLVGLAAVATLQGDHPEALERLDEARALLRAHGLEATLSGVWVRQWVALSAYARGDAKTARATAAEIVRLSEASGNRWDATIGEYLLGMLALGEGRRDEARLRLETCRGDAAAAHSPWSLGRSLLGLAELAADDESVDVAWELAHDALQVLHDYDDRVGSAAALEQIASLSVAEPSRALRLLGAAQQWRTNAGVVPFPPEADRFERVRDRARSALAPDAATASWDAGNGLTLDEAVAYARRGRGERQRPTSGWDSLTPVERDVVRLVAAGRPNAEIGRRLFISVNTVKKHLSHVYAKVDVEGRADLAAQAARREP